jgi:hypothetical protein
MWPSLDYNNKKKLKKMQLNDFWSVQFFFVFYIGFQKKPGLQASASTISRQSVPNNVEANDFYIFGWAANQQQK